MFVRSFLFVLRVTDLFISLRLRSMLLPAALPVLPFLLHSSIHPFIRSFVVGAARASERASERVCCLLWYFAILLGVRSSSRVFIIIGRACCLSLGSVLGAVLYLLFGALLLGVCGRCCPACVGVCGGRVCVLAQLVSWRSSRS